MYLLKYSDCIYSNWTGIKHLFLAKLLWQLSSIWEWNDRTTPVSTASEVQTKIHLEPLKTSEDTSKNFTGIPVKIRNRNWKFSQRYYLKTLKTSKNMHEDLPANPRKLQSCRIGKSFWCKSFWISILHTTADCSQDMPLLPIFRGQLAPKVSCIGLTINEHHTS